jgi:hypothetical protein
MADHGTRTRYRHRCRCDDCRAVENTYQTATRRRNFSERTRRIDLDNETLKTRVYDVAEVSADRHGRLGTYKNLGCRCEKCTKAAREYGRQYNREYRAGIRRRRQLVVHDG